MKKLLFVAMFLMATVCACTSKPSSPATELIDSTSVVIDTCEVDSGVITVDTVGVV